MTPVLCPSCRRSLEAHRITIDTDATPDGIVARWAVNCDTPIVERYHGQRCPRSIHGDTYRSTGNPTPCRCVRMPTRTTYPVAPTGWYTTADIDRLMADLVETEPREVDGQEALWSGT